MASTTPHTFFETKRISRLLQISLVLSFAVLLVKTKFWLAQLKGNDVAMSDTLKLTLMSLHIGLSCLVAILFLVWFYQSHRNGTLMNPAKKMADSSKMILWTLLPVINFVAPIIGMVETATASSRRKNHVELITAWWLATLIFISCSILSLIDLGNVYNGLVTYGRMYSGALAHVALFTVVTLITMRQQRKYRPSSQTATPATSAPAPEFKRLSEVIKTRGH